MAETLNIKIIDQNPSGQNTTAPVGSTAAPAATNPFRSNQGVKPPPIAGEAIAPKPPALTPAEKQEKIMAEARGYVQAVAARGLASIPGGAAIAGRIGSIAAVFGPVGIAAIGLAAGLGTAAIAARTFASDVTKQIQALRAVSGPLAASGAERDVEFQLARLRRADAIGADLARIERLRTRRETALFDIGTEIREVLLNLSRVFDPLAELLNTTLGSFATFLDDNGPLITFVLKLFVDNSFIGLLSKLAEFLNQALKWLGIQNDRDIEDAEDNLGPFMRSFLQGMPGMFEGQAPNVGGIPLDANPFRNPLGV